MLKSNAEVVFNKMLCSSKNAIECAFGRLKARCGFLTCTISIQLENVTTAIFLFFVSFFLCYVDPELLIKTNSITHKKNSKIFLNQYIFITQEQAEKVRAF